MVTMTNIRRIAQLGCLCLALWDSTGTSSFASARNQRFSSGRGARRVQVLESTVATGDDPSQRSHHVAADDFYPHISEIDTRMGGKGKGGSNSGSGSSSSGDSSSSSKSGKGKGKGKGKGSSSKGSKSSGSLSKSTKSPKSSGSSTDSSDPAPSSKTSKVSVSKSEVSHPTTSPTMVVRPTVAPSRESSNDMQPTTRPPIDMPAMTASPTQAPIDIPPTNPTRVPLTPFGLQYTLTDGRIPFRSEYLEVIELTRMYIEDFFGEQFDDTTMTRLDDFSTIFTGSQFNEGEPILIEYEASALFDADSAVIPDQQMLDAMLSEAFVANNGNGFVSMLQNLPQSNVFSNAIMVTQTAAILNVAPSEIPARSRRTGATAGGLAAAATLVLLAGGILASRRRPNRRSSVDADSDTETVNKKSRRHVPETCTVADTCTAAWTVDDDASYDRRNFSSERSPDFYPPYDSDKEVTIIFEEADLDERPSIIDCIDDNDYGNDDGSYHFEDGEIMSIFQEDEISSFESEWNARIRTLSL